MDYATAIGGVAMFTLIIMGLVAIILAARSRLVSSGDVTIHINDNPENDVVTPAGGKLLQTLASEGIFLIFSLWWRWYLCPVSLPRD
ncbi:Na(+)-translocating NADH-quinone reductase subunit F [Psychrobacter sp. SC65A.3]|nr:Na(+)-translocating NADH-quinone reductase subunit F [Psychrobacter sp. SC65A.3]